MPACSEARRSDSGKVLLLQLHSTWSKHPGTPQASSSERIGDVRDGSFGAACA